MSDAADTTAAQTAPYLDLTEGLRRNPPRSPDAVAGALGIPLSKTSLGHEGSGTGSAGLAFAKVSFRFLPGGEPNVLVITLPDGAGPSKSDVQSRFDGLAVTAAPRGRSPDEEWQLSREEYWGRITFGFPEKAPDRLRSIVFDFVRKR